MVYQWMVSDDWIIIIWWISSLLFTLLFWLLIPKCSGCHPHHSTPTNPLSRLCRWQVQEHSAKTDYNSFADAVTIYIFIQSTVLAYRIGYIQNSAICTYITLDFGAIFNHCPFHKKMIQQSVLIHTHKVFSYPGL